MLCTDNCGNSCIATNDNYIGLKHPGIGSPLIIMFCQGVFYFIILFVLESGQLTRARRRLSRRIHQQRQKVTPVSVRVERQQSLPGEDKDVVEERSRIMSTSLKDLYKTDVLIVRDVSRSFAGFRAVSHLSFGIQKVPVGRST